VTGFPTLLYKEVLRFWKVSVQTVLAPVLSALLYLVVFAHALADHVQAFPGVTYVQFLVPGLAMMSLLQNAFANSSSSLRRSPASAACTSALSRSSLGAGVLPIRRWSPE